MIIAVFGGTGCTGRPFCHRALDRGHEIVVFARSPGRVPFATDRVTLGEGDASTDVGVSALVGWRGNR